MTAMQPPRRHFARFLRAATLLLGPMMGAAVAPGEDLQTEVNVPVELTFNAKLEHADPFNTLSVDVVFDDVDGPQVRLPAFWDGGSVWKARFASASTGKFRFHSESSSREDQGLQNVQGEITVIPYRGSNPLYAHGPIKVAADHRHFSHGDGTPFFWLGDTWWMGLSRRLHWPEDFQALAADRKAKGFNVIQIVAGLYPDMPPFDERGANEAGFPWTTNYSTIRPEYFDAVDRRLRYLVDEGFTPCVVGAWGYFMPWMGVEKMKAHWRYLIARYGAMPVVWCAAGEANLPWYLAKGFPYDDRSQVRDWTEVMRYIRSTDPFHRLLTVHPTGIGRLSARHATDDTALLDFDMLQTPHGQREAAPVTLKTVQESYSDTPVMPVIDGEASYEMLNDSLPTEWTRQMFWLCMMNGAAGHTYGANGIWQVNRKGDPHGASPHGGNYGRIPWDEAMNLPGSRQVGMGKRFLEEYPWQKFVPHPEWAEYAEEESIQPLAPAKWIWFPEGNPVRNAPAAKRYFRRTFMVDNVKRVKSARLRISADDRFEARLNGAVVGSAGDWREPKQFNHLEGLLKEGMNVLAVEGENLPAVADDPAGLIACMEMQFKLGETLRFVTDSSWRCSDAAATGWDNGKFDDSRWQAAFVEARYGEGPWGRIGETAETYGPQTTGTPDGSRRLTYVPRSKPIIESGLRTNADYSVIVFDPVLGNVSPKREFRPQQNGSIEIPAPPEQRHDWVVVLEMAPAEGPSK